MKLGALLEGLVMCGLLESCAPRATVVESEGWASVDPDRPLESRQRALADAQRRAVEKALGVTLTSTTRVEGAVALEQSISSSADGVIREFQILDERSEADVFKVRIRARLNVEPPPPAGSDGCARVAWRLAEASRALKRRRIAVLPFSYLDERASDGPRIVREALVMELASRRELQVVENLGQPLDVDAVVVGSLLELPRGRVRLDARLVRLPDGLIVAGAEGVVRRLWAEPLSSPEKRPAASWLSGLFADDDPRRSEDELARLIQERFDGLRGR